MFTSTTKTSNRIPWNKGRLIGQKSPLSLQDIWSVRMKLRNENRLRDLALFNMALDSKLRACDLLNLRVSDVSNGEEINSRATVLQKKTGRPVQFEITQKTRKSTSKWIKKASLTGSDFLFPSRIRTSQHLSTRQYSRMLSSWIAAIGRDPTAYGTHSMRRTKATLLYRRTKNLRAIQLLLGHSKLDSTVRYLGIEIDDALEMSEQVDV